MLAIEITDDLDPTGLATLVLAVITFLALVYTRRALKQTQLEIELSRREVEEAHRPVVVPVADRSRKLDAFVTSVRAEPQLLTDGALLIPLENVGSGPALDVEATIVLLADGGDVSGAHDGQQTPGTVGGLGVGALASVGVHIPSLSGVPSFQLSVTYSDVAGKEWITVSRYIRPRGRFEDLAINTLKEGAYGLRGRRPVQPVPPDAGTRKRQG